MFADSTPRGLVSRITGHAPSQYPHVR